MTAFRPLQVTTKPRCSARVLNKWFHRPECSGESHQCPFPIYRNGLCKRHDPALNLKRLLVKETRLDTQLTATRTAIAAARSLGIEAPTENPS